MTGPPMTADLVIKSGRVIDPLSDFDAEADVAVSGGRVEAIGHNLRGRKVLDAAGMVVAPGFIDLHSHVHSIAGQRLQAHDGVTTALDLEVGASPTDAAYASAAAEGRPLNYGFSASWAALRMQVLMSVPANGSISTVLHHLGDARWHREASLEEQKRIVDALERELSNGALGVGVIVGYSKGTSPEEYLAVAQAAARAGRPVFTHARELIEADPTVRIDGPSEIVRAAAATGGHMHYCHIHSTSRRHIERVLELVARARAEGGRVTTEAYPYGSGATAIGAALLDPENLPRWGLTPNSIVYLPTGERVSDAARLLELRASDPGGLCIVELLRENDPRDSELLAIGMVSRDTMVASDAMPIVYPTSPVDDRTWPPPAGSVTHPRTAGTFAKTLRVYVRERATMGLKEAIRRSSTLPAQVLEEMSPAMTRKGRIQVGADADIVVFDADRVSDQATYEESCRPSTGFKHVLVNGVPVVQDGSLQLSALPGRPIRAV